LSNDLHCCRKDLGYDSERRYGPCEEQAPEILEVDDMSVLVHRFEGREFPEGLAAAAAVARTSAPVAVAPGRAVTGLVHGIDGQERC
jgi:hypothetical protein